MNMVIAKQRLVRVGTGLRPILHQLVQNAKKHRKILLAALAVCFVFYWYEIRPIRIHRACAVQSAADARGLLRSKAQLDPEQGAYYASLVEQNMYLRSDYESFYRKCVRYYGMTE